jgi:hypothetical protein
MHFALAPAPYFLFFQVRFHFPLRTSDFITLRYVSLNLKNLRGGAGSGYEVPLTVFADLHKKKKSVFTCES